MIINKHNLFSTKKTLKHNMDYRRFVYLIRGNQLRFFLFILIELYAIFKRKIEKHNLIQFYN